MSFDKFYKNRKDWLKPFYKSKRFDTSCRCHGSCGYCQENRMHSTIARIVKTDHDLRDYLEGR